MKKFGILLSIVLLLSANVLAQKINKTAKIGIGLYEIVYNEQDNSIYVAGTGKRGEKTAKIYKLDPQTLQVKSESAHFIR